MSQGNVLISHVEFMAISGQMGFFFKYYIAIHCNCAIGRDFAEHLNGSLLNAQFEHFKSYTITHAKTYSNALFTPVGTCLSQRLKSVRRLPGDFRKFFI